MISFNKPVYLEDSSRYMREAALAGYISGDGKFTKLCSQELKKITGAEHVNLTTSGSTSLDMAAILCGLKEGDEVILPSFTFSSTANAVVLTGATPVFTDIRPDTMNIDENLIEDAITDKTKAIFPVHYAGVACEMDRIMEIAKAHDLKVVEDAAQCVMSTYKGTPLGTIGDFGCISFHETKNLTMGEGGALIIKDRQDVYKAEILREKGTDRSRFFRGEIDKYSWVDKGGSYLPSDLNAAYLYPQLLSVAEITADRVASFEHYFEALSPLADKELIELPVIPEGCVHNGHIFYIKLKDLQQRTSFIAHMKSKQIGAVFHYVPLHSAAAGIKYGRFHGEDRFTTRESERLVRLPMYFGLTESDRQLIIDEIFKFFE